MSSHVVQVPRHPRDQLHVAVGREVDVRGGAAGAAKNALLVRPSRRPEVPTILRNDQKEVTLDQLRACGPVGVGERVLPVSLLVDDTVSTALSGLDQPS